MENAVVVGVDGSRQGLRALEWAARDAKLHGRPLLIVHALPRYRYDMPFFPPGRWEANEAAGREIVAQAVAIARDCCPSLEIDSRMPAERVFVALRKEGERAHVVVVGARGRASFGRLLLGSNSLQLAGHATCPVVVVRDGPNIPHNRIVVGVDGSKHSTAALGYAFEEASARNARVRAMHVWQLPDSHDQPPVLIAPDPDKESEKERRVLVEALAEWTDRYPDIEVDRDLAYGHPAQILVDASLEADMVIVGSRGRGGFHGLALGSVSHAVLHHAVCPVIIARPHP